MEENPILNDHTSKLLRRMMDLTSKRQEVISNNLTNANTPGYLRKKVTFEGELKDVVQNGNWDKLGNVELKTKLDREHSPGLDGNNVSVSREMNHMMQNGLKYNLTNRVLATRIKILKSAMK